MCYSLVLIQATPNFSIMQSKFLDMYNYVL